MRSALVGLVLVGLALAGCGSGRVGKEEFLARANKLCATYNKRVQIARPLRPDEALGHTRRVLAAARAKLTGFRAMRPPQSVESLSRSFEAELERQIVLARAELAAARRGDVVAYLSAGARGRASRQRSAELARRFGAFECTRPVP